MGNTSETDVFECIRCKKPIPKPSIKKIEETIDYVSLTVRKAMEMLEVELGKGGGCLGPYLEESVELGLVLMSLLRDMKTMLADKKFTVKNLRNAAKPEILGHYSAQWRSMVAELSNVVDKAKEIQQVSHKNTVRYHTARFIFFLICFGLFMAVALLASHPLYPNWKLLAAKMALSFPCSVVWGVFEDYVKKELLTPLEKKREMADSIESTAHVLSSIITTAIVDPFLSHRHPAPPAATSSV